MRRNRVRMTWAKAVRRRLKNLALLRGMAHEMMDAHVPDESLTEVHVNYPDPPEWVGSSQCLVDEAFLLGAHRTLRKDGGHLTLVTDDPTYAMRMCRELSRFPRLFITHGTGGAPVQNGRSRGVRRVVFRRHVEKRKPPRSLLHAMRGASGVDGVDVLATRPVVRRSFGRPRTDDFVGYVVIVKVQRARGAPPRFPSRAFLLASPASSLAAPRRTSSPSRPPHAGGASVLPAATHRTAASILRVVSSNLSLAAAAARDPTSASEKTPSSRATTSDFFGRHSSNALRPVRCASNPSSSVSRSVKGSSRDGCAARTCAAAGVKTP